ncbi:excisionase family DNA binding protein [Anaerotaenia torta]|uniref:helix-turn-helix domain-containing protein n=1 Tax=Anaerotaenia torta TaxID=433293 RepID=UPI003D1940B0
MLENTPDILTVKQCHVKQCQALLSVGKNTMLSLIHNGEIEAFMVNHRWRITKTALIHFIRQNQY